MRKIERNFILERKETKKEKKEERREEGTEKDGKL
jgi:hypothetical protein